MIYLPVRPLIPIFCPASIDSEIPFNALISELALFFKTVRSFQTDMQAVPLFRHDQNLLVRCKNTKILNTTSTWPISRRFLIFRLQVLILGLRTKLLNPRYGTKRSLQLCPIRDRLL